MCGIIWIKSLKNKPVRDVVIDRYKQQRTRGTQGFGFVEVKDNGCEIYKNTTEEMMMANLKHSEATEIIFHHRWPTSTDNVVSACHPFKSVSNDGRVFYLVHNGVLSNDDELKKKHEALGLEYQSLQANGDYNDSECLAHEFMLYITGQIDEFEASGSIAIMVEETDLSGKPVKFYFARNEGNPLIIKTTKNTIQMASEGEGVRVPVDKLYTFDYEKGKFEPDVDFVMDYYTKSKYAGNTTGNKAISWEYNKEYDRYDGYDELGNFVDVFYCGHEPHSNSVEFDDYQYDSVGQKYHYEDNSGLVKVYDEKVDTEKTHKLFRPPKHDDCILENISKYKDVNFEAGIRDGYEGNFTGVDYYKWICPEIDRLETKIEEYNELITIAKTASEISEIDNELDELYGEQMYFMGLAYQMYMAS